MTNLPDPDIVAVLELVVLCPHPATILPHHTCLHLKADLCNPDRTISPQLSVRGQVQLVVLGLTEHAQCAVCVVT